MCELAQDRYRPPKSIMKAAATIAEHGPHMVAVILQGSLATDNTLAEAGLVAQVKQPKPT